MLIEDFKRKKGGGGNFWVCWDGEFWRILVDSFIYFCQNNYGKMSFCDLVTKEWDFGANAFGELKDC